MICPCGCPNTIKIPSPRKMFKRSDPLMPISIYLATWNILSRPPEEDLKPLLGLENVVSANLLPDIYAIGLQEVKAAAYSILMDTILENPWVKALRLTLAPFNFVKIRAIRLQGMLLVIFIKRAHLVHVQDIETEYTRTGIGRVWGNKGGVSIRLNAFNCSICLVNCHLAAHDIELKRRIEDYNSIVDSQLFKYPQTENIFFHDYVFWLGDMNFRLDSKPLNDIMSNIEAKDYRILLEDDQLRQVRQNGEAFSELEEPLFDFAPTYKFIPGTHEYDINRRPAWTDRILYKVNTNVYEDVTLDAQMKNYKSHHQYVQSDHKPVSALYTIKVFHALPDRYVEFAPIKRWMAGVQHQVTLFLRAGNQTTVWDWIGLYKADFTNLEDYEEYIWMSGHGLAQSVPPASTNASEFVVESWEEKVEYSGHPIDTSTHPSGSGTFVTSWLASSTASPTDQHSRRDLLENFQRDSQRDFQRDSQRDSRRDSRRDSQRDSQREILIRENLIHEMPENSVSGNSLGFDGTRRASNISERRRSTSKSRERNRSSKSHASGRRISEHITSAVFRLASLFQGVPKTKYVVTFPELVAPMPGQYCLLYLSHGVDSIHGMSEPFEIRASQP